MGFFSTAVFQRSCNKGSGNMAEVFSGYWFMWFSRFVAPILGV